LVTVVILSFALLYLPSLSFFFSSYHRAIAIALTIIVYSLHLLLLNKKELQFSLADLGWLGLICLSFLSAAWSLNPYYAIYGGFSTLIIYLCFKVFEQIVWSKSALLYLRIALGVFSILALGIVSYANFIAEKTYGLTGYLSGTNNHYLCSLVLVLLPFLLVVKKKFLHIAVAVISIVGITIITYKVGSLQVVLCSGISCLFLVAFLFRASMKKILFIFLATLLFCLCCSAIFISNKDALTKRFSILNEFSQQNDRLTMWENSLQLFQSVPLLGVGKNNWKNEVAQYGLNDYSDRCNNQDSPYLHNHPHSWLFESISELGIMGLLSLCMLFFSCVLSLRNTEQLDTITYATLFSVLSFLWLGLMYGVVYNRFENFQGLPVFMAFCLSILNRHAKSVYTLNSKTSGILVLIGATAGLLFFGTALHSKKKYDQSRILIVQQKPEAAIPLLLSISSIWDRSKVYELLGRAETQLGHLEKADDYYFKALGYKPYDVNLLHKYARFLYEQEAYEKAYNYSTLQNKLADNFLEGKMLTIECLHKMDDSEKLIELATELDELVADKLEQFNKLRNYYLTHKQINSNRHLLIESKKVENINTRIKQILNQYH